MTRTRPAVAMAMLLTTLIGGATLTIPTGAAYPCIDENHWICDPNPDVEPHVGTCAMGCETRTYSVPGPGDDVKTPNVWLNWCQYTSPALAVVPTVSDTEGDCPSGSSQAPNPPSLELVPEMDVASVEGIALVTLVIGECPVSLRATVYNTGVSGQDEYVPCAHPA